MHAAIIVLYAHLLRPPPLVLFFQRVIAEKQIPRACLKFAAESAEKIAAKGLVHNFLAHLVSLCDFGLISPGVIAASMAELHNAS